MPTKEKRRQSRGNPLGRRLFRRWGGVLIAGVGVAVLLGALLAVAMGRPGESSSASGELPVYAYNSAATLAGYKAAVSARESLYAIPCYCGCGPASGHKSLQDCFFNADGSFTDHASNCHLCVEESTDVAKWLGEGVDLKEIRARIDKKYGEHGGGTNTPPL